MDVFRIRTPMVRDLNTLNDGKFPVIYFSRADSRYPLTGYRRFKRGKVDMPTINRQLMDITLSVLKGGRRAR